MQMFSTSTAVPWGGQNSTQVNIFFVQIPPGQPSEDCRCGALDPTTEWLKFVNLNLLPWASGTIWAAWRGQTGGALGATAQWLFLTIHSHKTLDTAQPCHLLKPNWKPSSSHSISILTNISTQFLLQSLYVCVFVVRFFWGGCLYNTFCKLFW